MQQAAGIAGTLSLSSFMKPLAAAELERQKKRINAFTAAEAATDEDFWGWVRESYTASANIINLNNGGVSPQPKVVQDAHIKYYELCNEGPSYYMWRILDNGRESLRMKLAELAGVSPEEIAIDRNSTEALNTIIFGLNLKAGDEVVLTKQDYPNMINAWLQREKRDGIKLNFINLELPIENDDAIVEQFAKAFTPKTKVVMITHIINWVGQVMPVKKIAKIAHEKGIEVLVDGAHSFALLDFKIPDLDCDYFGTSLHKWLCAPFGSGMLYIKKEKIDTIWTLLSNRPEDVGIRRFESLGTRSFASEMAIGNAIDFHEVIGAKRKEARLRFLKNYWASKAALIPKVKIHTSLKDEYSCAIAMFSVEGWKPTEIESKLMEKYKIHAVAIDRENMQGVRVTPHIYTTLKELDRLVKGISDIAAMQPPSKTTAPKSK